MTPGSRSSPVPRASHARLVIISAACGVALAFCALSACVWLAGGLDLTFAAHRLRAHDSRRLLFFAAIAWATFILAGGRAPRWVRAVASPAVAWLGVLVGVGIRAVRRVLDAGGRDAMLAAAGFFAALAILYAPALARQYDFHDAFYLYAYTDHDVCASHPQYAFFFAVGRPLYALINCYGVAHFIGRIEDTWIVRLFAVLVLTVSAVGLDACFRRMRGSDPLTRLMTLSLLVVPGVQVFVNVTQASPIIYSFPLVIGSALLVRRSVGAFCLGRPVAAAGGALASLVLLMASTLIFQQMTPALFVLVFIFAWELPFERRREARALIALAIVVYAINGVAYLEIGRAHV